MTLGPVPELHTENHYQRAVAMLVDARILGRTVWLYTLNTGRRVHTRISDGTEVIARFKVVTSTRGPVANSVTTISPDEAMELVRQHRYRLKNAVSQRKRNRS